MKWHIGQEIVCVKSHPTGFVKKNQTYIIKGLRMACNCCIDIDVGCKHKIEVKEYTTICTQCNKTTSNKTDNTVWLGEFRFAPLEYDKQAIEELIENQITTHTKSNK